MIARMMIAIAVCAGVGATLLTAAEPTVEQPAPDFSAADRDGNQVKLSSFRGKHVVLAFTRAHW